MHSKIWKFCAVSTLVMGVAAGVAAQNPDKVDNSPLMLPGHQYDLPGTLITAAQQQEHLAKMRAAKRDDVPMNMVKMGGGEQHQVGISIVYREKGPRNPPNYAVHDDVAEVYYILEGKATMKLGGKITDWKRRGISAGNGRGSGGQKADGGTMFNIAKGDILIIPAGTPHLWVNGDMFTAYAVVRIDPNGVAPLLKLGDAKYTAE